MKRPTLRLPVPLVEKQPELLPKSALNEPATVEEAENMVSADIAEKMRLGTWKAQENCVEAIRESWADMQSKMLPGDQLFTYHYEPLWAENGIALLRRRRVIAKVVLSRRAGGRIHAWDGASG